jgi:putative nucleotidyltransferase with HDIG domain
MTRKRKVDIVAEAAAHARATYPAGDWPHIAEVVAYAQRLAKRAGAEEEIVTLAAYFHDISRATMGAAEHHVQSAAMARQWLSEREYPVEGIERVAAAVVAHMLPVVGPDRDSVPIEGRILYDADKISRTQGMALLGGLARLGRETPWENLGYEELAHAICQARRVTEEAYESLYTAAARELASPGYERAIAFCDGLLEMPAFSGQGDGEGSQ